MHCLKKRHHLTDHSLTSSFVVFHDRIEYVRIYSTSNKHNTDHNQTSNLAGIDTEIKSNKPYQHWITTTQQSQQFATIRPILWFVAFVPEPLHLHLPAFFAHFPVPSELRISRQTNQAASNCKNGHLLQLALVEGKILGPITALSQVWRDSLIRDVIIILGMWSRCTNELHRLRWRLPISLPLAFQVSAMIGNSQNNWLETS